MGYVADRWHKSRPKPGEPECGEHKGKVASRAHGKGKRWQARYDGPDGGERTSLHRTAAEAEREIIKQESAKMTGSWVDPKAGKVTVETYAFDTWLPAQNINGRTEIEYRGVLNRYLVPEWGTREIRSIKPSEAGAWQQLLLAKYELSGSTPNSVARRVRSVFRLAVIDRVIAVSPFAGIKAPTLVESTVDPPDLAEVLGLVDAAYHVRWRAMIDLTAMTGLRSGEIRGLRVDRIDRERGVLRVEEQLVYERGRGLYFDDLKTGAGRRVLPLTDEALTLLAEYVTAHPPAVDGEWAGLVFTMPGGEPIGESTLDWALKSICRRAGGPARHWHELRHHYASVLIAGGENPKVVQKRLGHKDVLTTLRVYSHLWAEAEERTRGVLDDARRKAREAAAVRREGFLSGGMIPEGQGTRVASGLVSA
ncbi:tyrosine-type recombinase/integrase [Streptomyces hoynatensis]|uniref:Site-specific integrase n=1 Tax=Streptomyces hoynatensis TaxID=1141874 RepID=A0A3A9YX96_9ACTN|nr:site-specific integrase [Streptomyces hoynatensis]RKN40752.1 site-specific integrase [Streptomyces hoynatensis]